MPADEMFRGSAPQKSPSGPRAALPSRAASLALSGVLLAQIAEANIPRTPGKIPPREPSPLHILSGRLPPILAPIVPPLKQGLSDADLARAASMASAALTEEGAYALSRETETIRRVALKHLISQFINESEQRNDLDFKILMIDRARRKALGAALGSVDPRLTTLLDLEVHPSEQGHLFAVTGSRRTYVEGVRQKDKQCEITIATDIPVFDQLCSVLRPHRPEFLKLISTSDRKVSDAFIRDLGLQVSQALKLEELESARIGVRDLHLKSDPGNRITVRCVVVLLHTATEEIQIFLTPLTPIDWDYKIARRPRGPKSGPVR